MYRVQPPILATYSTPLVLLTLLLFYGFGIPIRIIGVHPPVLSLARYSSTVVCYLLFEFFSSTFWRSTAHSCIGFNSARLLVLSFVPR